ncbi:hypothetical protein BOTBODRAFT_118858 [Botryobasidium botryosum FD-172 SS1]|uniref:Dynein light intermediate chain n=1 Tax=Botryobasidium botryosum (strain FD-172 SS1) TaxID=930990 RepID=A0A067M0Q7_BOTB1|nr:hypothetical protein BOTBODRAFT_118858 [Botryobasidium botryosum FD-172 SS1]
MSSSSRPPSPQQDLWSSILNSVSSTRSIPSKNVIVLGEPESGKSTLVRALLQKQDQHSTGVDGDDADRTGGAGDAKDGWGRTDFALGYEWADVRDEADEGKSPFRPIHTIARLSVYTVPSSSPAHLSLLPHFLPPKSAMPHSLVMIVLDWTRPWSFVDQLQTWLAWVEKWVHGDGARELEVIREEGKERLQSHLQHYTEPTASGTSDPLAQAATTLNSTLLPLGQGTLTHNSSGIPIIVVCTKADLIDDEEDTVVGGGLGLLKGKGGEWEERTDGIMQALRTICLKYGAALFYSTPQPSVLAQLRLYTLHFLFTPLPPAPSLSTAPSDAAPLKNPFPFPHRPNVLDRDRILVPAGWDSWGKISVVREGFDAARWGEAWERDLDGDGGGAKEMFRVLVGGDQPDRSIPLPALITTEPEQAFLARYHETLAKDPDRDPRGPFRPQPQNGTEHTGGVVGPMSSSSFTLPSVVKVMTELDGEDVAARLARAAAGGVRRVRVFSVPIISYSSSPTYLISLFIRPN